MPPADEASGCRVSDQPRGARVARPALPEVSPFFETPSHARPVTNAPSHRASRTIASALAHCSLLTAHCTLHILPTALHNTRRGWAITRHPFNAMANLISSTSPGAGSENRPTVVGWLGTRSTLPSQMERIKRMKRIKREQMVFDRHLIYGVPPYLLVQLRYK